MSKSHRKGPGKGSTEQSKSSKGHGKKQIKNARGLRDVLGMGAAKPSDNPSARPSDERKGGPSGGRSGGHSTHRTKPSSQGGQRDERGKTGGQWSPRRGAQPEGASKGPVAGTGPKGPKESKLTYIMSFQPPADVRPEPSVDTPRRFSSSAAPATGPDEEHTLKGDLHTRSDFKWPKTRFQAPAEKTKEHGRSNKGRTLVTGVVKRHPDGYGFLIPDNREHPDVYISRQSMMGVMTNDRVEVEVYAPRGGKGKEDRLSGDISKIVSRSNTKIVGRYLPVDSRYGVILEENRGWGADLRIAAKDSAGAKEGDMVAVEILKYPGPDHEFTGRVIDIIGDMDDPVNDVIRVIHDQGIPSEFSKAASAEARQFGGVVTPKEIADREDLTHLPIVTIDGVTARDFDDAIWVEQTAKGFHLIVGIADVSHYVKPGTQLDQEAYERGTSTYFPNYVVPMLPEELSNELCSLKPKVKRLSFACEMNIDFNGDVVDYRFFEAVIESKARVTYGEAQELIDWSNGIFRGRSEIVNKLKHVEDNILRAADLAKILMAKRFREGSLDLEIPETQVVVDSSGETSDIIRAERLFAHRLIEELMLVTNICTARFFEDNKIPGIYRIHEEPDPENIQALQRYLWNFGGHRSVMGGNLQKKLSKALEAMQGKPEAQILNILTLRTMQQAKYSAHNVGHFGLGFTHYSHFTSPIRRYPDLIAHRMIKSQLNKRYHSMAMTESELESAATMLSACEQRSVKAERKVISIKKARFIRQFIGQEFEGIISSVTKFGVFILLRQYDVDGLIKIENLGPDRFNFDDQNLRLIGARSGLRYTIGDILKVLVTASDLQTGKIDFDLAPGALDNVPKVDQDEEDELDFDYVGDQPQNRKSHRGPNSAREPSRAEGKRGAKGKQKNRVDSEKRGKTEDNRRGLRKKRLSKRR